MDLFGQENKIKKVKEKSISSKAEMKKIERLLYRDKHCKEVVDFPNNNEVSIYVSKGLSDAGSFLYAFYEKFGIIEEALIATWTISKANVLKLIEYIDSGKIKNLTFLLNDGMLKTSSTKPIYGLLRVEFDKRNNIKYSVANSHAKVQAYKSGETMITISGSGNWSLNPRIEDYVLIGGEKTFNFTKNWIQDLM